MKIKLLNANDELIVLPDTWELSRLVEHYPTYKWEHRTALLRGYFEGKTSDELVDAKLIAKAIDKSKLSPQSLGGHARWVKDKVKRTIIRLLYLRYRIDNNLSRIQANQQLLKKYPSTNNAEDAGASTIRKATSCLKLDK